MIGKSGDGIYFEHPGSAGLIEDEVDPREAAGSNGGTGTLCRLHDTANLSGRSVKIENVASRLIFVLRVVIEERPVGLDLDGRQGPHVDETHRPFAPHDHPLQEAK